MIPSAILILAAVAAAAAWNMPDALRIVAVRVMARAESIEAQRATYAAALSSWKSRLANRGEMNA